MQKPSHPVTIEWSELVFALEAPVEEVSYLDLQTGNVVMFDVTTDLLSGDPASLPAWQREEIEEARRIEADDGSRYRQLPDHDSSDDFAIMNDFTATVADDRLRARLGRALGGPRPFRAFKDAVHGDDRERERWYTFREARLVERLKTWLAEENITPLNPPPQTERRGRRNTDRAVNPTPKVSPNTTPAAPTSTTSAANAVRCDLIVLAVGEVRRSVDFYAGAFAWPIRLETPHYVELELPGGRGLGLYQREAFRKNTGSAPTPVPEGRIGCTELYLYAEDVTGALARLHRQGARLLSPLARRDWGDEAAYYADPDGNVVVIARRLAGPQS